MPVIDGSTIPPPDPPLERTVVCFYPGLLTALTVKMVVNCKEGLTKVSFIKANFSVIQLPSLPLTAVLQ